MSLTASGAPVVYDFGGFDAKYYRMTYETPDASSLADRIASCMPSTEPVHQHVSRGLDHGAWVPLKIMYPDADIPVLQMSLPTPGPGPVAEARRAAAPVAGRRSADHGLGFLTHGLPFLTDWRIDAAAPGWSTDFDAWPGDGPGPGDVDALAAYRDQAPGMPFAHPTVEHYTPLFVTLGAATNPDEPGLQVIDGFWLGLSKRSLQVA